MPAKARCPGQRVAASSSLPVALPRHSLLVSLESLLVRRSTLLKSRPGAAACSATAAARAHSRSCT